MHREVTSQCLEALGNDLHDGDIVVEQGVWLGASLAAALRGARGKNVTAYGYDRFQTVASELPKAAKFGVELREGMDTLPLVEEFLSGFQRVHLIKAPDIATVPYEHGPIALYIDDANKRPDAFQTAMEKFTPHFLPGRTMLALMDYGYYRREHITDPKMKSELEFQRRYISSQPERFELVTDTYPGDCLAVFRYLG